LEALLGDDALVDLLLAWMAAPVEYEGAVIERQAGLPQGSPLSPLLANVLLDEFDRDLATAGCKLAHSGKQFVVLCRNKPPHQPVSPLGKFLFAL
jgi:CRISP-associated protein Cas1